MRAIVMFGAGDVRIENVPAARIIEPTDAVLAVSRANAEIDTEYRTKYSGYSGRYVNPMVAAEARGTTMKLVPR